MVRRASGGGAILHDAELTYSLAVPTSYRALAADPERLYTAMHGAIVRGLAEHQVAASLRLQRRWRALVNHSYASSGARSATCSWAITRSRAAPSDGIEARFFSMEAFCYRCRPAPELPGVNDLAGVQIKAECFANTLQTFVAESLHLYFSTPPESDTLKSRAMTIMQGKFAYTDWTLRR